MEEDFNPLLSLTYTRRGTLLKKNSPLSQPLMILKVTIPYACIKLERGNKLINDLIVQLEENQKKERKKKKLDCSVH